MPQTTGSAYWDRYISTPADTLTMETDPEAASMRTLVSVARWLMAARPGCGSGGAVPTAGTGVTSL
ncbi:hypothetical protein GCM10020295_83220 [Streptomyces cinereospinus]